MIVVIPFGVEDQVRAERLCDAIYWVGGANPKGHCLLVHDSAVHQEFRFKAKLAAQVAFLTVDMLEVGVAHDATKTAAINTVFRHAARYILDSYRQPWLWLEADAVPLKSTWLEDLFGAYHSQPFRYMGRHMKGKTQVFLSRTAIYPVDCIHELDGPCQTQHPFERVASVVKKSTNSGLIHMAKTAPEEGDPAVVWGGMRSGGFIESAIESAEVPKPKARRRKAA